MVRMLAAAPMACVAFLQVQAMQVQDLQDLQVQAVPLGEVVITHAGSFEGEYLYATQDDDGKGGRLVHTWMKGSLREASSDPQARWNISQVDGSYVITRTSSFKDEYLYASRSDDSRGGHYVHTWTRNSLKNDPKARWNISKVGRKYVITHADSLTGARATHGEEYLCATQHRDEPHGWRYVHTLMREPNDRARVPSNDPQALWAITPVATSTPAKPSGGPRGTLHGRHHGRPKGARAHARERALAKSAAEEVASTGCVNLGGDKWFSDAHGRLFQVSQDRCSITFKGKKKSGELYEKKGVVSGYQVHVDPPFPAGHILPNQNIVFENGARWELKWP
jgi:hypothetical protein